LEVQTHVDQGYDESYSEVSTQVEVKVSLDDGETWTWRSTWLMFRCSAIGDFQRSCYARVNRHTVNTNSDFESRKVFY